MSTTVADSSCLSKVRKCSQAEPQRSHRIAPAHNFGEEQKADPEEYANIPEDVIVSIKFDDGLNGQDF
jgi:hypothetical protein